MGIEQEWKSMRVYFEKPEEYCNVVCSGTVLESSKPVLSYMRW